MIIDKLPLNIKDIGFIHRLFPESKFIFVLRNPIERKLKDRISFLPYLSAINTQITLPITKNKNRILISKIAYSKSTPGSCKKIGMLKICIAIAPLALKVKAIKTHIKKGIL